MILYTTMDQWSLLVNIMNKSMIKRAHDSLRLCKSTLTNSSSGSRPHNFVMTVNTRQKCRYSVTDREMKNSQNFRFICATRWKESIRHIFGTLVLICTLSYAGKSFFVTFLKRLSENYKRDTSRQMGANIFCFS